MWKDQTCSACVYSIDAKSPLFVEIITRGNEVSEEVRHLFLHGSKFQLGTSNYESRRAIRYARGTKVSLGRSLIVLYSELHHGAQQPV